MFEKEAEEYANGKGHEHYNYLFEENSGTPADFARRCFEDGAEFGYNKANEWLTLPKDILGLWEQTLCEIRSEIKSWDLKGPHVSDYAKELCDKLEHSMCAVAGGPYSLRYSITD